MSKLETFTAPEIIETVALSDLYLSEINPRQEVADEGIALLAESLVTCGLIQNLSGLRDKDGKVGIVAGGVITHVGAAGGEAGILGADHADAVPEAACAD